MDRTYRTIEFKSRRGEIRGGFFCWIVQVATLRSFGRWRDRGVLGLC